MVDRKKLYERLMATFVDELDEHVDSISRGVLELEKSTHDLDDVQRGDVLASLFRAAHSLKGASRAVDIKTIESVCHSLEEVFFQIREGKFQLSASIASVVLAVADRVADAGQHLRSRESVADDHFGELPDLLHRISQGESPSKKELATIRKLADSNQPIDSGDAADLDQPKPAESDLTDTKPPDSEADSSGAHDLSLGETAAGEHRPRASEDEFGASDGQGVRTDDQRTPNRALESSLPQTQSALSRHQADDGDLRTSASQPATASQIVASGDTSDPIRRNTQAAESHKPEQHDFGVGGNVAQADTARPPGGTGEAKHSSNTSKSLSTTIRVAEEKLDDLMAQAGELLAARQQIEIRPAEVGDASELAIQCRTEFESIEVTLKNLCRQGDPLLRRSAHLAVHVEGVVEETLNRLRKLEEKLAQTQARLVADARLLNQVCDSIQEDIHRIRMVPFVDGCAGLDRVVRDVANVTGKNVDFEIHGGDVEIDRAVLDQLRDPLMHLVRNAIDHGIELPEERISAGKSEIGRLSISLTLKSALVEIVVQDDGKGINHDAIIQTLKAKHLPIPRDEREIDQCIFLPGFSTSPIVTGVSGRGVGMDVVKSQIERLHGSVEVSSIAGSGTSFCLSVPITLSTTTALIVKAGNQSFAIPSSNIARLIRFSAEDIRTINGRSVLSMGDSPIGVTNLPNALGLDVESTLSHMPHGVLLQNGDRKMITVVDELVSEQEIVIKSLGPQIRHLRYVSGASFLGTGEIALLINVGALLSTTQSRLQPLETHQADAVGDENLVPRILVVDDSVTTRTLLRGIIETAGYDVIAAVDGEDAWQQLQNTDVALVVSDVDMPNLDGYSLTERIRDDERLARTPVVLVTSRETKSDKARGVQVGADAYIVKGNFEQTNVLDTIDRLIAPVIT